jgi:hypothetical protein
VNVGVQLLEDLKKAARQPGNDTFGLHFGNQFLPKQLGAIGYAANWHSSTCATPISR